MHKKAFIGVDLHTDNFTACYLRKNQEPFFNKFNLNDADLEAFLLSISKRDEIAIESVSNAAYFKDKVQDNVKKVTVVATGDFSVIAKSVKKTDKNDAYALALYLSKGMVPRARIKTEAARQLSTILDTRAQLVKMRASLMNKTNSLLTQNGIKLGRNKLVAKSAFDKYVFCHKWDGLIEIELKLLHRQIYALTDGIEEAEREIHNFSCTMFGYENLLSIKGIGPISASILISTIDDVNDFKEPSKLASYFGIVPKVRRSNDVNASFRITKRGSKVARSALVQCTWVAIKYSPYLNDYYERIKKRRGSGRLS